MPSTYREFREALRKAGFIPVRSRKHETWEKTAPDGAILQVRISHQHGRDIPKGLFHRMLRQAGLSLQDFISLLKS